MASPTRRFVWVPEVPLERSGCFEGRLIGLAHAFETAAQARRTPGFLPSFDERMDG